VDRFEHSFIVAQPVETVYARWSRFDKFSEFVPGIESVRLTGAARLEWTANVNGSQLVWDTDIVESLPNRRIAWRSDAAPVHRGSVELEPQGAAQTIVKLEMEFEGEDAAAGEHAASVKELMAALAGEIGVFPAAETAAKTAR